jgi:hypothetical protein
MIICRKRNFVFLRVTKTASTSITHHLLDHIPKDEIDHFARNDYIANMDEEHRTNSGISGHATIGDLIRANLLTHEEVSKMRIFGVVRDPVERFLSAAHHYHVGMTHKVDFANYVDIQSDISNEEAVERYLPSYRTAWDFHTLPRKIDVGPPQWHWLLFAGSLINGIVPFGRFDKMFQEIGVPTEMPYTHRREHRPDETRKELSPELRERVINVYRKDWEIWNQYNV